MENQGHRTVVSQRALQVHTDPLLGWTSVDGVGYVVSEVSPYEVDLEWDGLIEPDDIAAVVDVLGRATAKMHCASDEDSDQDLVDFQVEEAIADMLEGRRREFAAGHRLRRWPTRSRCARTTRCSWRPSGPAVSAASRQPDRACRAAPRGRPAGPPGGLAVASLA